MFARNLWLAVIAIFAGAMATKFLTRGVEHYRGVAHDNAQPARAPTPAPARESRGATVARPAQAARPQPSSPSHDTYVIPVDRSGHYMTDAEINGVRVANMMVDTGATLVSLSYEDAESLGVVPAEDEFRYTSNTANGVAHNAHIKLREVRVGGLSAYDVDASVGEKGALAQSLLGMSYLSKLGGFEVTYGALVMRH